MSPNAMRAPRRSYFADALIDLDLEAWVVTVPCERRAGGRLLVYPMPVLITAAGCVEPVVRLQPAEWLVHDAIAGALPVRCSSQHVARQLADAFAEEFTRETIDAAVVAQVEHWCRWWLDGPGEHAEWADLPYVRVRMHAEPEPLEQLDETQFAEAVGELDAEPEPPALAVSHLIRHTAEPLTVTEVP